MEAYSREQKEALYNGMLELTRPATKTEVEVNVMGPPLQVVIASVPRLLLYQGASRLYQRAQRSTAGLHH